MPAEIEVPEEGLSPEIAVEEPAASVPDVTEQTAPSDPVVEEPSAPAPVVKPVVKPPLAERTAPLFAAFFLVAAVMFAITMVSVHDRDPMELPKVSLSARSYIVLTNWLKDGYFHYFGMINRDPAQKSVYRNSTGGYMVSGFIVEKLYSTVSGHYSYRLLAYHNQGISMILSALAGLLSYRLARRLGVGARLGFAAGASVVVILFTFPDNLDLFWEMSAQAYGLLFALLYLVLEERSIDLAERPRMLLIAQAATVFLMTVMESIVALGFILALAGTLAVFGRNVSWKRFVLVVVLPCIAALALYQLQVKAANARFPNVAVTGSRALWRSGFDGDTRYYGDHLGIVTRRDVPRRDFQNAEYQFIWKWVFILGVVSVAGVLIAFLMGRAPRFALEALAALTGSWLFYAAIFSQAIVVHPYLYDVLLFTPLCIALFALGPALLESATRRTGAIVLVIVFSAFWYSFYQMRLYALRRPMPPIPNITGTGPNQ